MKQTYLRLVFLGLLLMVLEISIAQVRVVLLNPANDTFVLKNYGASPVDVSNYWICSRFSYAQLSGLTINSGDLNLAANEEVEITSSFNVNDTSADFGLYTTNSFASSAAIHDFLQFGASGIGRESVAQAAGIWTSGDFINQAGPYEFTGNANDRGSSFWQTATLSVSSENVLEFSVYPNPVNSSLSVELPDPLTSIEVAIYDLSGRLVFVKELSNVNQQIDVNELASGMYSVVLMSGKKIGVNRIVKR